MLTLISETVPCRWWRRVLRWCGLNDDLHAMFCPSCD